MRNRARANARAKFWTPLEQNPESAPVYGWLVVRVALCFLHLSVCWSVGLCVPTYYTHNNYVTYIVACDLTLVDFGNSDGCFA